MKAANPVEVVIDLRFVVFNDLVPGYGRLLTHGGGLLVLIASPKANLPELNHRILFVEETLRYRMPLFHPLLTSSLFVTSDVVFSPFSGLSSVNLSVLLTTVEKMNTERIKIDSLI